MNCIRGNKCVFINCGKSKRIDPELSLYRFPKDDRSNKWVVNSGKKIYYS